MMETEPLSLYLCMSWRRGSVVRTSNGLCPADFLCPAPDLWLRGDHFVGNLSAMCQPTQPSIPPGSVNE